MTDIVNSVEKILDSRDVSEKKKKVRARGEAKKVKPVKLSKKAQQILELANRTVLPDHYKVVWTEDDLEEMCQFLNQQKAIAVDTETMGLNPFVDEIVGISLYAPHRGFYIPLKHDSDIRNKGLEVADGVVGYDYVKCLPKDVVATKLKPILENPETKLIFHNYKFDAHVLFNWMGIRTQVWFDTSVAQALLDENQSKKLKDMAPLYLKIEADKFSTLFGKEKFSSIPILLDPNTRTGCLAGYYAIKDTELTYRMCEFQYKALKRPQLQKIHDLFFNVEMPFLDIVWRAEQRGVRLDRDLLENKISEELRNELKQLESRIYAFTGEINLNSWKQISNALYRKLGLPMVNKDKPNSTDKRTLKKLKNEHEVIGLILEYRAKVKLVTAFVDKLPKSVVNGRVHTNFNTVGGRTGRMSSDSPNLCGAA